MKESQIQKQVAQTLDMLGVVWTHPPNEQKMLSQANNVAHLMSTMKDQGLKPGLPDCLIFTSPPNVDACGAALEIKAGSNTPTDNQIEWLNKLESVGWDCEWKQGIDECYSALDRWGYM